MKLSLTPCSKLMARFTRSGWLGLTVLLLTAWTALAEEEIAPAVEEEIAPVGEQAAPTLLNRARKEASYRVRLRLEYDYRESGEDRDSDLYGYWYARANNLADGRIDLYTSGRTYSDLDDTSTSYAEDIFVSLDDLDDVTQERVLQLYAEIHDRLQRLRLRGGRQYVDIADFLQLDGGQFMLFEDEAFGGRVYAGQPVSYYTSVSGDLAGGLSLVGRPWWGNRTRFTFARYEDDSEEASDENYFLDFDQKASETSRFRGKASVLNGDFRMASLDFYYFAPDSVSDLYLGASYWGTFDARTRLYSPLYSVLGELQPYTYAYGRFTQEVQPWLLLSPGISARFVDGEKQDFSNRDYANYDLTFIFEPNRAWNASVAIEYWDVEDDDTTLGLSGDIRYRHGRIWEVSGGAAYLDYSYNTYSDFSYVANGGQTVFTGDGTVAQQSPDAYTYFLRAKWNINRHLMLRVQGDIEDNSELEDLAYRGRGAVEVRF